MPERKTLKIREPTASRFDRFARDGESQTATLSRLLDRAGVPESHRCSECGTTVQAHARDEEGRVLCFDCAGISVDPDALA